MAHGPDGASTRGGAVPVTDDEFRDALAAARLAVADDDYERAERAALELVGLARRAKQESGRRRVRD